MANLVRKINVAMALLLMSSMGQTYADYGTSLNCDEVTNACPVQTCCGKGYVCADFLYWRAFENGLDRCVSGEEIDTVSDSGFVTSSFKGKSRDPRYKWAPGYRVGAGYEWSNWFTELDYTHFQSHSSDHTGEDFSFKWNVHYDVVDYTIGYTLNIWSFIITPYLGVRGARINQSIGSIVFDPETSSRTGFFNRQRFNGAGPVSGFRADWLLGCGFGLYVNADIANLWGQYKIKAKDFARFPDSANTCDLRRHSQVSLLAYDSAIGVTWQTCFCNGMELLLNAALEQHRYFDFNRLGDCGDMIFEGGTLSACLEF